MSTRSPAEPSGVVFRASGTLYFLPAAIAQKVLPMPGVGRVPGGPPDLVGVALVEGEMVPVVAIGDLEPTTRGRAPAARSRNHRPMLVCSYLGERICLVGLEVLATGRFAVSGDGEDGVLHDGSAASTFDVGAVFARLREGRWAV